MNVGGIIADVSQTVSENLWANILVIVIAAASSIAALFPKPKNRVLLLLYHVVNFLAVNVRHAKNREDVPASKSNKT